jgi:hypothetical protein
VREMNVSFVKDFESKRRGIYRRGCKDDIKVGHKK